MKRKEDDLARLDGKAVPLWAKILGFVLGFVIAFFIFAIIPRLIRG